MLTSTGKGGEESATGAHLAANQSQTDPRPHRFGILGIFAGLLPQLLAIPAFALGRWSSGLVISLGGNLLITGSLLVRRKPISSLALWSLILSVLLAIAYFGFGSLFFLKHFGVVINGLLLGQVLSGELRAQPWTVQFSKRLYPPERWGTRAFFEANRFLSRLWGVIFGVSLLMAAIGRSALFLFILPNGLLVLALVLGPSLGHWYGARFLQKESNSFTPSVRSEPLSRSSVSNSIEGISKDPLRHLYNPSFGG